jgi:hypothetical protein
MSITEWTNNLWNIETMELKNSNFLKEFNHNIDTNMDKFH